MSTGNALVAYKRRVMLEKEKLTFHPITIADRDWINEKLKEENIGACEYTFSNNFVWAKVYDVQVGMVYGCGVIRYRNQENFEYSFPFGNGDKKAAIELLKGICAAHGHGLRLYPIVEKGRLDLIEWFPGEFEIDCDRDDFDYVYTVEKLSTLRGKKLHGKRNHIARFMDDNDWRYEAMTNDNLDACREMAKEWISLRSEKWNDEMEQEIGVLEIALSHFDELGLVGGILYKSEKMVAITIGEPLNADTFVVHFEKAYPDLQGAYPMINQQFVLHEAQDFTYVNREEDTGDLGLRKAKLSYYPDILLTKYYAVQSHVVFANEHDRENVMNLWQTCFGDDWSYIQFYFENRIENENMFVIHEDGKPVSMASMLPVQITINGEWQSAKYVYAVATLPQYRKKGYASEIIKHAADKYKEPLILQPAEESLHEYYNSLGFSEGFEESPCWVYDGNCTRRACILESEQKYEIFKADTEPLEKLETLDGWDISDIGGKEYKEVRDRYFEGEAYVAWDEKSLDYAIQENEFCNGKTLLLTKQNQNQDNAYKAVIMYRVENNKLNVVETTLEDSELQDILPKLLKYTNTTKAFMRNMGGMIWLPEHLKSQNSSKGYLGLTLI